MLKLSKASKMPCRSWSLQALDTCPASRNLKAPKTANDPKLGDLVDACKGCYATSGNYRFPNVKAPRVHNREDWKRDSWVADMIQELDNDRYFRWFDSGDIYDVRLARKILEVCEATPWVKHWIPTRMHKFPKFTLVLQRLQSLPNVVLRLSSDSIIGETIEATLGSNMVSPSSTIATLEDAPKGSFVCEAYTRGGKCDKCRACWDKGVSVVTYIGHGKSMVKNQNNLIKTLEVA